MLKEKVDKYIKANDEAKKHFDRDADLGELPADVRALLLTDRLSARIDALTHIVIAIVDWAEKIEDIRVLTKEKQ